MSARLRRLAMLAALSAAAVVAAVTAGAASAAPAVAHWHLESRPAPTNLPLEGEAMIVATASNLGDAQVNGAGEAVKLVDKLPAGVEVTEVKGTSHGTPASSVNATLHLTCSKAPVNPVECAFNGALQPYEQIELEIRVKTKFGAPAEPVNEVSVSGGEAKPESTSLSRAMKVNGLPTEFGLENYELTPENEEFNAETRAGSHPFQLTTTFDLNQTYEEDPPIVLGEKDLLPSAPALQKNLEFKLPPGMIGNANVVGNPHAAQQCSDVQFGAQNEKDVNNCAADTVIGVAAVTFNDPITLFFETNIVPVFNLVPAPGEPAKFGFEVAHVPIVLDTSVRTGSDYGVNVKVHYASQAVQVLGSRVTIWGEPTDPRHNDARGWECLGNGSWDAGFKPPLPCKPSEDKEPSPFLLLPTACGLYKTEVQGEAWNASKLSAEGKASTVSGSFESKAENALTGCEELPFEPSIEVTPDQTSASTPTGLTVKVHLPQAATLETGGRGEADIRSTTLELPEGLQTSAGAANGLQACTVEQAGFLGENEDKGPTLTGELEAQQFTPAAASCPEAAKLGTVSVNTPLLPKELKGAVYLATQDTNPFASPLVLYIIAEEEDSHVLVKLAGEVNINPTTGQLTSSFKNTPQTPFEDLTLHLFNTERASQATPAFCGSYHANAKFTTWSSEQVVERESPPFTITSGPNGTPCPGSKLPFSPSFQGGAVNPQAGAFTPFTVTIGRADGNQALQSVAVKLPPGAAAMLASVTPCPESIAAEPEPVCPASSLIGHSTAWSGLGGKPYALGGEVFLTGPYKGAPFGLLAVTNAVAGPFNLGKIPVRSTINVDPNTAAATITSDPIPQIVKGAPAQIKQLNVTIDRPGFQFNPTNCNAQQITSTLTGYEEGTTTQNTPYQVTGCSSLAFSPTLTVSTSKNFDKINGVNFDVKVTAAAGQANIAKTKLVIPKSLPSRLTTIQKACPDSVFNANPASCDEGSNIGYAIAHTPVLKSPLTGPAYLVSHGGAAFPDVEFVLQGEGIKLILDGSTDIKNGVTTSTFNSVPDAPVSTFEAILPAGPHSALAAYEPNKNDLCGTKFMVPTTLTGQNGMVIEHETPVKVEGCGAVASFKAKKLTELQKSLKLCKKAKKHSVRVKCEAHAHKRYAAVKACKKHDKKSKSKRVKCEKAARKKYPLKIK